MKLDEQNRLMKILKKNKKMLFSYSGVWDVGIGKKIIANKETEEIAFVIFVYKKFDKNTLSLENTLPKEIEGIPIDVIEARLKLHMFINPYIRSQDLLGGLSISNPRIGSSGTLGAIVFGNNDSSLYGLTCYHVLFGQSNIPRNKGRIGDNINQPANTPNDSNFNIGIINNGDKYRDCAIFTLNGSRQINSVEILNGIQGKINGITHPIIGLPVKKTGARTGLTFGIISNVSVDQTFTIKPNPAKLPINQEISASGDSGSLWISDDNQNFAIGLNLAGIDGAGIIKEYSHALSIQNVMSRLNISFY